MSILGFGLGLRPKHYTAILKSKPHVDWFEALTENYMVSGGRPLYFLDRIRERFPVVLHGISMSIGSTDQIDRAYLGRLAALAKRVQPEWISDHLCWTGVAGHNLHDLMPLPYSEEALHHVSNRVRTIQNILGRRILIENVSSYVAYRSSVMTEWEFLTRLTEEADCDILLDVNNIYVSAFNHGFDPIDFLKGIPPARVKQIHLAGHDNCGDLIIDTHDAPVIDPVWNLYAEALRCFGPVPTMIERDDKIPPLGTLVREIDRARIINAEILHELNI
jgi:uncharacterized protein